MRLYQRLKHKYWQNGVKHLLKKWLREEIIKESDDHRFWLLSSRNNKCKYLFSGLEHFAPKEIKEARKIIKIKNNG